MEYNYKELCQFFGESPVRGGAKQKVQLTRFGKTHEIEKVGRNRYQIIRERTEEEIQLASDKEHYSKYLQTILLNMIADSPNVTMTFTYRQIREKLRMVNEHYFPVKYRKEQTNLELPSDFEPEIAHHFERRWIDIADDHDSSKIKYCLGVLQKKHLITCLIETYVFYKFEKDANDVVIYHPPVIATMEQLAEIHQRELDFIKAHIPESAINQIKEASTPEKFYGACIKTLYALGHETVDEFYDIVTNYAKEQGYTRYAKAFTITRPTELKRVSGYFAPEFNKQQVQRYLATNKFKTIPPFIHEQMTEKLIKS